MKKKGAKKKTAQRSKASKKASGSGLRAKRKAASPRDKDEKIAKNFKLSEFTNSRTAEANGLSNRPGAEVIERIKWVATSVAQPIRDALGASLSITSGYRSPEVNALVGGVKDSYHTYSDGRWAFDCHAPSVTLEALMDLIISLSLPLSKAILELDEGVIHLQGERPQYLARDIVRRKKIYVSYESYKKTGKIG